MIDDNLWYLDIGDTLNIDIITSKLQTLKYKGFVLLEDLIWKSKILCETLDRISFNTRYGLGFLL